SDLPARVAGHGIAAAPPAQLLHRRACGTVRVRLAGVRRARALPHVARARHEARDPRSSTVTPASIDEAAKALRERKTTCVALARAALAKIEALQPQTNAFLTVTADAALARAAVLDQELGAGRDRGPLHGI